MSKIPTRDEALAIYNKHNSNEALLKHALNVEGVMRYFARKYGEDEEYWGVVGLLHDLDYENYPEEHCKKVVELLEADNISPDIIRSVVSHGYELCADVKPEHKMEKVLYATDELTGLVSAAALMRPSKSVMDLEYKSLWKKYKSPAFAAGVDRNVIEKGCEMMGVELKDVICDVILAMREVEAKGNL